MVDQAVRTNTAPTVYASLSLSTTTYSFSGDEPPLLHVTITSYHRSTITIYADDLCIYLMRRYGAFKITDLADGVEIPQLRSTYCKLEPPSKVQILLNEDLFYELPPGVPVTISGPFGGQRKQSPGKATSGSAEDQQLRGRRAICGVECMETGHCYAVQPSELTRIFWTRVRWWDYGTKEEVIQRRVDDTSGLDARKVRYRTGPHGDLRLDTSHCSPMTLRCVE